MHILSPQDQARSRARGGGSAGRFSSSTVQSWVPVPPSREAASLSLSSPDARARQGGVPPAESPPGCGGSARLLSSSPGHARGGDLESVGTFLSERSTLPHEGLSSAGARVANTPPAKLHDGFAIHDTSAGGGDFSGREGGAEGGGVSLGSSGLTDVLAPSPRQVNRVGYLAHTNPP